MTTDELDDFRADLGDQNTPPAFSDDEIQRLYVRSDDSFAKTKLLAINQLLMNASKLYNYVSGHTRQEQQVIFDNLLKMREILKEELGATNQVHLVGLTVIPPASNKQAPSA
jgi:hypothetical protein